MIFWAGEDPYPRGGGCPSQKEKRFGKKSKMHIAGIQAKRNQRQ